MNPWNLATTSSPPPPVANDLLAKRKRGRPRKDETFLTQQENSQVTPNPDVNLVGQMVSGVVEGSFDAGYLLNVKVKDSDIKLRGVVFIPGKVTPITPENDLAPTVQMFGREETKNQTDDQSVPPPPNDQPIRDVAVTDVEISESARALSLMPQESNGKELAGQAKEAMVEKEKDGDTATRLVEFFPTPETTVVTAQPNLVLSGKETTEKQKPSGETSGFDLMVEKTVCPGEKVPEELQLELGNKTIMSVEGNNNGVTMMETDSKTSVSKSGFIANLFEGEDKKKAESDMEVEATPSAP